MLCLAFANLHKTEFPFTTHWRIEFEMGFVWSVHSRELYNNTDFAGINHGMSFLLQIFCSVAQLFHKVIASQSDKFAREKIIK